MGAKCSCLKLLATFTVACVMRVETHNLSVKLLTIRCLRSRGTHVLFKMNLEINNLVSSTFIWNSLRFAYLKSGIEAWFLLCLKEIFAFLMGRLLSLKDLSISQYFSLQKGMFCSTLAGYSAGGQQELSCMLQCVWWLITLCLSGLSTALSAWGPGTSGDVWGCQGGDHGPFVSQGQGPDVPPQSHSPPSPF